MANATIVQLGSSFDSTATTFEQEFSEARGRGRARRQARRQDRIKKRDERRSTRQATRQGRKAARQTRRAEMRDTRRQRRQDSKMRRVEARQDRKMRRSEGRQARKDVKAQRELDRDAAAMEQQNMMDEGYGEEMPLDEPIMQDQAYDEGGYDEGGYSEEGGYDEGAYAEEGGYDEEGGYEDEGGYEEEGGYDEEGYEFDGDNYEFFDDGEGETPFDFADGSGVQVAPMVQDVANRIEWNKELCCRLKDKAASGTIPQAMAKDEIAKSVQRIDELKSCLDAWCNFEGEFMSDANGNVQFKKVDGATRAKLANRYKRKERIMALRAALAKAKNERKRLGSGRRIINRTAQVARPMQSVTSVEMGLSPKIGNQRIVIPAKLSNADGNPTGIIGIDDAGAIDSSYIDIKLGADGDKSKTSKLPMKPILIAVGIGALIGIAYFAFKKK